MRERSGAWLSAGRSSDQGLRSSSFLFPMLLFSLVALPARAQHGPGATFDELIEVSEVLLDVLATDRSGEPVTGLGKEDFIVTEDGEQVDLTSVSYYTTRYGPADSIRTGTGEVPSSRYFIFFFHTKRGGPGASELRRRQLKAARGSQRWIEEGMLPSDWVAVVSYENELRIHLDFTQDREQILEAIEDAARGREPQERLDRRVAPSGTPSLLRHLPHSRKLPDETKRVHDGVRLVADASAYIVGRKNLLMFTVGLRAFGRYSRIPTVDPLNYPPMEEALNDANVAVYTIDLRPIVINHILREFMIRLSKDTGGSYQGGFVDFFVPLEKISAENVGYYLLSYQSQHPASERGFQQVRVESRDRSVTVRTRRGYRWGV